MIDLAREKIDQLYSVTSLSEVNAILSQLFTIIPRKMENVEDYLAHTEIQGMLVNDEVVVYDDKQATIRYLIELA